MLVDQYFQLSFFQYYLALCAEVQELRHRIQEIVTSKKITDDVNEILQVRTPIATSDHRVVSCTLTTHAHMLATLNYMLLDSLKTWKVGMSLETISRQLYPTSPIPAFPYLRDVSYVTKE